jgi:hypothetical protein
MSRLATNVAAQAAPAITDLAVCGTSPASSCDAIDAAHACPTANPDFTEIHGRMTVPIYQTGTEPYATPTDGGGIVENGSGVPQKVRDENVCFALTVPKGPAPGTGFRLAVYSHGTGGSMRDFINEGIADKLATGATPVAGFSFDSVEHGARRGASTANPEDLVFNILNPRAARDNFLQGAADILTALRISGLTISSTKFDTSSPVFFGHSQGSTSGELALAYWDANPGAAVFSGAGSSLTASLLNKTSPANYAAGLAFLVGEPLDGSHPVMTLLQNFFDRSDPVNYVHMIITAPPTAVHAKHVFMTWGTGDTYTPLATLEANALTMGIPAHTPMLEDSAAFNGRTVPGTVTGNISGHTGVMFQYAPPTGVDGHFVATQNTTAVANWNAFIQTFESAGVPTVP